MDKEAIVDEKKVWVENTGTPYGRLVHGTGVLHVPAGMSEQSEEFAKELMKRNPKQFKKGSEPKKEAEPTPVGVPKTAPATK